MDLRFGLGKRKGFEEWCKGLIDVVAQDNFVVG